MHVMCRFCCCFRRPLWQTRFLIEALEVRNNKLQFSCSQKRDPITTTIIQQVMNCMLVSLSAYCSICLLRFLKSIVNCCFIWIPEFIFTTMKWRYTIPKEKKNGNIWLKWNEILINTNWKVANQAFVPLTFFRLLFYVYIFIYFFYLFIYFCAVRYTSPLLRELMNLSLFFLCLFLLWHFNSLIFSLSQQRQRNWTLLPFVIYSNSITLALRSLLGPKGAEVRNNRNWAIHS